MPRGHRASATPSGCPGTLATRLQPNHPTDDPRGIAAAILDGLLLGCGDAVIGINPATDSPHATADLLHLLDDDPAALRHPDPVLRARPTSPPRIGADRAGRAGRPGVPVDRRHRGRQPRLRHRPRRCCARRNDAAPSLRPRHRRRQRHVLRDRPGLGAVGRAHLAPAARSTSRRCEARAYAVARALRAAAGQHRRRLHRARSTSTTASRSSAPGWRTTSAASCSACRWAVDVCYTNHAEADQDDMDTLLTLLGAAGVQPSSWACPAPTTSCSTTRALSFHDALYVRRALGLRPAPEFEAWLRTVGHGRRRGPAHRRSTPAASPLRALTSAGRVTDRRHLPSDEFWDELRKTTQARIGLGRAGQRAAHPAGARVAARPRRGARRRARAARRRRPGRRACATSASATPIVVTSRAPDRERVPAPPRPGPAARRTSRRLPETPTPTSASSLADGLSPRALADHGAAAADGAGRRARRPLHAGAAGDRDAGPGRARRPHRRSAGRADAAGADRRAARACPSPTASAST